jgi:hypothetical protein
MEKKLGVSAGHPVRYELPLKVIYMSGHKSLDVYYKDRLRESKRKLESIMYV